MRGLPRSGKSTWAKEYVAKSGNTVIVSRDYLREMLHNGKWTPQNEKTTMRVQDAIVKTLLRDSMHFESGSRVHTVIVDDTNLTEHHLDRWKNIARECGVAFEIHHEKETDIGTLIRRDNASDSKRGSDVIIKMALQSGALAFEKDEVVICDLDGTLCDIGWRRKFVKPPQVCMTGEGATAMYGDDPAFVKDWKSFFEGCAYDLIREDVMLMLSKLIVQGKKIIFVSGRPESCRHDTEEWLSRHRFFSGHLEGHKTDFPFYGLLMRPAGDSRADTIIKKEILDRYLQKEWIHKVIDDRPSVVRMWREAGLTVEDVGDGVEF